MKQLEEYAAQANDCRKAAAKAATAEEIKRLLEMADRWEELARERAAYLHLENLLAELLNNHNGDASAA